jgi:hypothetical protein
VARFTALLDASVLYSMAITDLAMETARAGIYQAKWTVEIHQEWVRNLTTNRPDLDPELIKKRRDAMDKAIPDASILGYESLISALVLPDPNDRHVLAAAIVGSADVIVTKNLKDFPADTLAQFGIEAQHPDVFLIHQRGLNEGQFLTCVRTCRRRLKRGRTPDEYLDGLSKSGLVALAAELSKTKTLL